MWRAVLHKEIGFEPTCCRQRRRWHSFGQRSKKNFKVSQLEEKETRGGFDAEKESLGWGKLMLVRIGAAFYYWLSGHWER